MYMRSPDIMVGETPVTTPHLLQLASACFDRVRLRIHSQTARRYPITSAQTLGPKIAAATISDPMTANSIAPAAASLAMRASS